MDNLDNKVLEINKILSGLSDEEAKSVLEKVVLSLSPNKELSMADTIVISYVKGGDEDKGTACGGKACPFHHWARITNPLGPGDSICELPGDGGNVICCYPDAYPDDRVIHVNGRSTCNHRRLPKCLALKPPTEVITG